MKRNLILSYFAVLACGFGASIYGTGGEVTAVFVGASASWDSHARLGPIDFFPNHGTAPGTSVSLGTWGTEDRLPFQLVVDSAPYVWSMGVNPDGQDHVRVSDCTTPGSDRTCFLLSWEDWPGMSDFDYNDHEFRVFGARDGQVPEPGTFVLVGLPLVLAGAVRRNWAHR